MTSPARATFLALTLCSSLCQGCLVVPMKAPTKSTGASGEAAKGKVDLAFLQEGKTTREEVLSKLWWTNTAAGDERFFLGRWSSSSSGTAWVLAGNGPSGMGGWNRNWKTHN